ncbi:MAG: four helix bundle protein [Ruminococcaceae bacterium]|nr:four helix bundle protein [Oscillospiraceae bacterium]
MYIIKGGDAVLVSHHTAGVYFCRLDDIQNFVLMICNSFGIDDIQCYALILAKLYSIITIKGSGYMSPNYLLMYSERLATDIELLCQNIKTSSNTIFQIRKSSSSVYANIREANYGQSKADMLSKFEISLKECSETEGWLKLLFNTNAIDELTYKKNRNLCGRIRRMLISSCKTLKESIDKVRC